jgi:hypothetical protein
MASRFILPFADVGSGIKPSSGARLFFYETGTSTPKDTFTDQAATTPNANPVIADSNGVFSNIFIDGNYKVILQNFNSTQIWEADPVVALVSIENVINIFDNIAEMKASPLIVPSTALCIKRIASGPIISGLLYQVQSTGVGETLTNGNIAVLIENTNETGSRDVNLLMAPSSSTASLTNSVFLEKLRDTLYVEFAAYTPISQTGLEWHRWLFTNRFNVTNDGAPRMINCSLAYLYVSTQIARTPANNVSETRATATTATRTSSAGTTAGTWVGPATVLTTTDVLYSSTVGNTITYTITGVERIELRGLLAGNGGIASATVTTGGVEIAEANYLLPTGHLVNFISTATGNTTMHIPLAKGLATGSTYTVVIEVDATNPVSSRIYQAGLLGFADIAFNAVGISGIVLDATLASESASLSTESGTTAVYSATDITKLDWKYVETNVASIVNFTVYNSVGTIVATDTLDMYGIGSTARKYNVTKGLAKGTYYLHVENGKTKNALSTDYRYYDLGATFYDQTIAGTVGTDDFDNNDVPNNVQDPNNGSEYMLIGAGNIELAVGVRKPDQAVGAEEFVGGIHGFETTPVPVFTLDNSVFDFAAAAAGTTWNGKDLGITFTTTLNFAVDDTNFCTVNYDLNLSQGGYRVKTTKTTLAASIIHDDYTIMLNTPNTAALNQGLSVGGGFENIAADINYTLNSYDNAGTFILPIQKSVCFVNLDYSALAYYNTVPVLPGIFSNSDFNDGAYWSLLQDRTDRTLKFYTRAFNCNDTTGVTIPTGTSWSHSKVFRVIKGNNKALVGI